MNRRSFIATTLLAGTGLSLAGRGGADERFEVTRSEAEWKAMLSDTEYAVMREESTERAFSSPLHDQKTKGTYLCRGCDLPLYSSEHKFDSKTGWPSFWQAIDEGAVATKRDWKLVIPRTECHCSRCGSHLGHIFDDGPEPTGKRHCINGVSLVFKAA
ncbi:peptide-methionine (R)-S-oxide reductase [Roseovarius halotolerans]|uniref:peptide-methionine (R)-S-oxide reductase n=1 Tax=Roseovarius halotolerans TaxID=505353 RepID=A0A1X6Z8U7_9RHOB|nr:peptide-methionine (R)-S-oxide reductase MsrB [Roseovarius halotolerans]RKT30448.1 peptide-methionine (R)-S-oxide reductase [Roseovarius halotolerans]SLN44502.1 Peptide methionine sulfoxide reductase MsrB [Roseovarius halotolerans]